MTKYTPKIKTLLRAALGVAIVFLATVIALHTWGAFTVYTWYLNVLTIFGLACSAFVVMTWTPYIIRARYRGPLNIPTSAVIDWATLAYLGLVIFSIRLVVTATDGTPVPTSDGRAWLNVFVWSLIAFKVGLRAYVWLRALRAGPDALDDMSAHIKAPAQVVKD